MSYAETWKENTESTVHEKICARIYFLDRGQLEEMRYLKCTVWEECAKFSAFRNIGQKYILYPPIQLKVHLISYLRRLLHPVLL